MCIFLIKNNESFIIEYICESAFKKKRGGGVGVDMIPTGNLFVSKIMLQTLILLLVRAKIL